MRKYKLTLEYDGARYAGWQRQENGQSIQGEIENVLAEILQEKVDVVGAGRTDAGVHARGQVAHVSTNSGLSPNEIRRGMNGLLPDDIVVLEIAEAGEDFHARYSARERRYSYLISRVQTALLRNYSWYVKYPLDINLLLRAADEIKGTHDFRSFCRSGSDVDNYICTVVESKWDVEPAFLRYTISANRFLRGMVRAIVGTMVDVGRGHIPHEDFAGILGKKNRSEAGTSAPAKGLTLENVLY